ncbi:MAG: peptidylprolyl isomerase [Bacteroidota bacterium]|jgi:cyclophilin family peptidyl-prolyl cis-trans isomerase
MRYILALLITCLSISQSFAKEKSIKIETNYGVIILKLYENTPLHTANLVKLCKEHYFDSTLFHRVIPSFVIQGGDPDSKHAGPEKQLGDGDLSYLVPAEINAVNYHKRGALGMARDNNPEKKSSACQFYIVVGKVVTEEQLNTISTKTNRVFSDVQRKVYTTQGGTPFLDGNYTVFGEVTKGMEVVDTIAQLARNAADRPNVDVRMLKVRVLRNKFLGIF